MLNWLKKPKTEAPEVLRARALEADIRERYSVAESEAAFEELTRLAAAHPELGQIRSDLASGAMNLQRQYMDETPRLRPMIEQIAALIRAYPGEPVVLACHALQIREYMNRLGPDRIGEVAEMEGRLTALYRDNPSLGEHAGVVVEAGTKLLTEHLRLGGINAARAVYDRVRETADRHPADYQAQYSRCGAGLNMVSRLATVADMGPAERDLAIGYFREMEAHVARSPLRARLQQMVDRARGMVA